MDKKPVPKFASFRPKPQNAPAKEPDSACARGGNEDDGGGRQRAGSAVPKFTSFKPNPQGSPGSSCPGVAKETEKRKRGEDERETGGREHHRSRHTKPHSSHHPRGRQRSRSAERRQPRTSPKSTPREEALFVIDKRGDPLIVRYGSNERSKVPAYRRSGGGRVLGAEGRLNFVYDGSKELFSLGNKFREGSSAFRDRNLLVKASRKKSRVFRLRAEPDQNQTQPMGDEVDFLPLSGSRKHKRDKEVPEDMSGDEEPNYRSIQGKANDRDFVDSDLESVNTSESESDTGDNFIDPLKQNSTELSRRVKEHPEDVDAWLELVDLQEALLRLDDHTRQDRSNDETKGLASIRVSLLEEALPHAPCNKERERLLLRYMREGCRAWGSKTLAKRWAEISFKDSGLLLWKAHVDYELSNMATFTYDRLVKIHFERIQSLRQRLSEVASGAPEHDNGSLIDVCNELIYVFLRTTRFIQDAGFSELAVAAWQAVLELSFARPTHEPDQGSGDLPSSFGEFWESEVPRMGEDSAKGWRYFTEAGDMEDLSDANEETAPVVPINRDVYEAWAAVEEQGRQNARWPARTMDKGTEDDPFRVVLFLDLELLLFYIPWSILASMKSSLLDAFLLFCHLPPTSKSPGKMIEDAYNDQFIFGERAALGLRNAGGRPVMDDVTKRQPSFRDPGSRLAIAADVLFPGPMWFGYFDHDPPPQYDLALAVTTQLALSFRIEDVAEYSLALAWKKGPTSLKKAAKALLKQYPHNTALYNAYALASWRNGMQKVAQKVFKPAMSQDLANKQLLWNTWAWLELESGDMRQALCRCVASVAELEASGTGTGTAQSDAYHETITPTQILKTRQTLTLKREFLTSTGDLDQAASFAQTLALLQYLDAADPPEPSSCQQGNIAAAMASVRVFENEAISHGQGKSPAVERLLQFAAHLLYLYASRGPFRPPFLREELSKCIAQFPTNTMFLNLFAWADKADSVLSTIDPTRMAVLNKALADDHLSSRIFDILHQTEVGTVHSVRRAFDRAVDSDACRGNVGLWLSYVRFCRGRSKEVRGKAREVFYRAISTCSWSKSLAMEAFTTMAGEMEPGELREVFNTMVDKGLRIHVDLDEFISGDWVA